MNDLELYRRPPAPQGIARLEAISQEGSHSDLIDFTAIIAAFRRRILLFSATVAGVLFLAILALVIIPPSYTGTARVAINAQDVQVAPTSISGSQDAPVVSSLPDISSVIDTEVTVIESRRIAEKVVASLHLEQDPEFSLADAAAHVGMMGKIKHAIKGVAVMIVPSLASQAPPLSAHDYTVSAVMSGLTAVRFNLTNSIDINFSDPDPVKAAKIANAFAQAYLQDQVESKFDVSQQANTFLQGRLGEMRQQYLDDIAKLQQYKIAHNLMSSGTTTLTEQEISSYNQQVAQAKVEAAADQASLNTAKAQLANGSTGEDVGEALSSGVIQALRAQRAELSEKVADMQGRYGEKYPELLVARRQLADIDQQIQAEINRVISNLEAKAEVSRQRLASIEGTLSSTKSALAGNNQAEVGLDQLQQNADASQALYQSYLNRLKETAAQAGSEHPDARLLTAATMPTSPSFPIAWLFILLGIVMGVGIGVVVIFVAETLDSGLTTADDVERRLALPYLAGIPLLASVQREKGPKTSPIDAVVKRPLSAYAEAFRNLRASITYAFAGIHPTVVMVGSALPREGKTTLAISLARTAALQGVSTVLIDCDTRRRGLNQIVVGDRTAPGLIEVLTGTAKLGDALVADTLTGAMILPLRDASTTGVDLFGGAAMDALLAEMRRRFELVVLDTAPLLPIADGRVIATKVDAVVLVARWRKTGAAAVKAALRMLPSDEVRVAGMAMTLVDMRKQSKYGYGDPGFYYKKYKEYYT